MIGHGALFLYSVKKRTNYITSIDSYVAAKRHKRIKRPQKCDVLRHGALKKERKKKRKLSFESFLAVSWEPVFGLAFVKAGVSKNAPVCPLGMRNPRQGF